MVSRVQDAGSALPFCGGSSVTSVFKAFISVFMCVPSTWATQALVSGHWVCTGFSSRSLCWASWGLFHEGTIPEMIPGLKLVHTQKEGIFSRLSGFPPTMSRSRAFFFFSVSLARKSGVCVCVCFFFFVFQV